MPRYLLLSFALIAVAIGASRLFTSAVPQDGLAAEPAGVADAKSEDPHADQERIADAAGSSLALAALPGFEVRVLAGDALVHNAYCLTTDDSGRVAVSGPGYIRLLIDRDNDGRADAVLPFADGPRSGAQGLCFDGRDLLAVGDSGLLRYRDNDGDGRADGPPTTLLPLKTGSEHRAHAVRRGPDGWWYLICGNETGIGARAITAGSSPVTQPEAGVLLRFRYESNWDAVRDLAVVADGMRNAYDFDFSAAGDPIAYDSDGEREVSLPWYQPTRVYRLTPGSHAGWFSRGWKRPDAFPEMPEVLARLGRGSPTGVVVYRQAQFPEPYRDAVFVCDWTFGRVVAISMNGSDEPGTPIEFLTASGSAGFAPTDVEVAADGSLLVCAGGRGTTGTVFHVRYVGDASRTAHDSALPAPLRQARRLSVNFRDKDAISSHGIRELRLLLENASALVRRVALEALAEAVSQRPDGEHDASIANELNRLLNSVIACLDDDDAGVRRAAMHVVCRLPDGMRRDLERLVERSDSLAVSVRYQLGRLRRNDRFDAGALEVAVAALERDGLTEQQRCDAVRLAQLALGDVGPAAGLPDSFSGYTARASLTKSTARLDPLRSRLVALFSTDEAPSDHEFDREFAHEFVRLLAMLRPVDPVVLSQLLDRITADSHPTDDLHCLFAIARLPAARTADETVRTAAALIDIDQKLAALGLRIDSYWDERLGDLSQALAAADPAFAAAVTRHPDFGRPAHVVLVRDLPAERRAAAAVAFVDAADETADYRWTADVIALVGESNDPRLRDRLRSLFDEPAARAAVIAALATTPVEADRPKFVAGLAEPQIEVVERSVAALEQLSSATDPQEIAALVSVLRRLDRDGREYAVRDRVARLLQRAAGDDYGFVFGRNGHKPQPESIARWTALARSIAPQTDDGQEGDWEAIRGVLSAAGELAGDAERGKTIYEARSCGRCHEGGSVGPDLAGVAGRFSREDLFLSIADPDRDVSPRYRGTLIQTVAGKVVTGLVVYESVDGVTLKDGTTTWRVEANEIEFRKPLDSSLMPRGLLKDLAPQDLADLEAYLNKLGR